MTTKNTIATAKTAIACALVSALTLGAACAPALAAQDLPNQPVVVGQSARDHMSEGEAVYYARTYLGIAAEDVYDLDVDLEYYGNRLCFDVEIETWSSRIEHHVMVDAYDGTILGHWIDD